MIIYIIEYWRISLEQNKNFSVHKKYKQTTL